MSLPKGLRESLDAAARRMFVDLLLESSAMYWRRRAEDFRAVGTPWCDEIAEACENRARVSLLGGDVAEFYALLEAEDGAAS